MKNLFVLILFLISSSTIANELEITSSLASTEGLTNTLIGGHVCPITGEFVYTVIDKVIPGPTPLVLQRTYTSRNLHEGQLFKSWELAEPTRMITDRYIDKNTNVVVSSQYGAKLDFRLKSTKKVDHKYSYTLQSTKGSTNCSTGILSGKTNLKNHKLLVDTHDKEEKFSGTLISGDGTERYFGHTEKRPLTRHYDLKSEKKSNRTIKRFSYHKNNRVKEISISSTIDDQLYSKFNMSCEIDPPWQRFELIMRGNDAENVVFFHAPIKYWDDYVNQYKFVFYLREVRNPSRPTESYSYTGAELPYKYQMLSKITWPEKRFLEIEYYTNNKDNIHGNDMCCIDRVMQLKEPVGNTEQPITTHRLYYSPNKTKDHDALGRCTEYHYNNDHRLTSIAKFKDNQVYSFERYQWGPNGSCDEGNLAAKYIQKANGPYAYGKVFYYDNRGNIERFAEYSSVSGNSFPEVVLANDGKPINNGAEHYDHVFYYDELNRVTSEWENNGKNIQYTYFEDTPAILSKILKHNDKIILRELYTYDKNLFLLTKTIDDGPHGTLCKITYHTPRTSFPFGFSKEIKEVYKDPISGADKQLCRVVNEHSSKGKLIRQDHFDANDKWQYALIWDYDAHGNLIKEIDAIGREIIRKYDDNDNLIYQKGSSDDFETEFYYDFSNRLIKTIERHADVQHVTTHKYDVCSNRIATIDQYGNESKYVYDDLNRLVKIQHPPIKTLQGSTYVPIEEFGYDILGFHTYKVDKVRNKTKYKHNSQGNPLSIIYPDGTKETFEYWQEGTLSKSVLKNGSYIHYDRDCLGRIKTETLFSISGEVLSVHKRKWGASGLESETDPEGMVTSYNYDGAGRLIFEAVGKSRKEYFYDALGRLEKEIDWISSTTAQVKIRVHDLLDRVIEERLEDLSGNQFSCIKTEYDLSGNIIRLDDNGSITLTKYNSHNEPIEITDAEGNCIRLHYDYQFRDKDGAIVKKITRIDPLGNQSIQLQDHTGSLIQETRLNSYGKLLSEEYKFYNGLGNLILNHQACIVDGKITHFIDTEWVYTSDQQIKCLKEALGTCDERMREYEFNSSGQKVSLIKPDKTQILYTYDAKGRLATLVASDKSVSYCYYYNKNDQVTKVDDLIHGTCTQRQYDEVGRLSEEIQGTGKRISYSYDALDRKTQIILPDQTSIEYVYDAYYLREVRRPGYSHFIQEYNLQGLPINVEHPLNAGFSIYRYDALDRPILQCHPKRKQTNVYDEVGNLVNYTDYTSHHLTYNDSYQLIKETGNQNHSYEYDSLDNRLKKDLLRNTYNYLNQLTSQENDAFTYDKNGNLIKKCVDGMAWTYSYDALGRLIKVGSGNKETIYTYDSFDRRLSKRGEINELYLYDGQNEIGIFDGITTYRILGLVTQSEIGATIAIESDGIQIPLHDHNGNIVTLLSPGGEIVKSYSYTAFGEEIQADPNDTNPYRFASKHFDSESGLIYFGRRYYDPSIGRWVTPDPSDYDDGPNLYAYVHNNPLTHIDAYGLWGEEAWERTKGYAVGTGESFYGVWEGFCAIADACEKPYETWKSIQEARKIFHESEMSTFKLSVQLALPETTSLITDPPTTTFEYGRREAKSLFEIFPPTSFFKFLKNCSNFNKANAALKSVNKIAKEPVNAISGIAKRSGIIRDKLSLNLDALSNAGKVIDRGELTLAGRALDKHGGRINLFPKATGNILSKNTQGQYHLDDILTNPKSLVCYGAKGINIYAPDGRGAYFYYNGTFRGFIEHPMKRKK